MEITIERNLENIYLTEAWDAYKGSRFLGTAVATYDGGWKIVRRGSTVKEPTVYSTRQAAFIAIGI